MNYSSIADELGDWFLDRPLDVNMEADVQCRLVGLLRDGLRNEGQLRACCRDPPLVDSGKYAQYKRPYIDQIIEKGRGEGTLPRVRPEVNLSDPDGPNEQIDVVVFGRELQYPISWNGGSKRYDERDVEAAFELKFVKNQNVIANEFDSATLRDATEREMKGEQAVEQLHTDNRSLESDLRRLDELPANETYLVIFSNYNYLFQPQLLDEDSATKRKNRKVGRAVDTWLISMAETTSTDVLYVHPGGKTWWR